MAANPGPNGNPDDHYRRAEAASRAAAAQAFEAHIRSAYAVDPVGSTRATVTTATTTTTTTTTSVTTYVTVNRRTAGTGPGGLRPLPRPQNQDVTDGMDVDDGAEPVQIIDLDDYFEAARANARRAAAAAGSPAPGQAAPETRTQLFRNAAPGHVPANAEVIDLTAPASDRTSAGASAGARQRSRLNIVESADQAGAEGDDTEDPTEP